MLKTPIEMSLPRLAPSRSSSIWATRTARSEPRRRVVMVDSTLGGQRVRTSGALAPVCETDELSGLRGARGGRQQRAHGERGATEQPHERERGLAVFGRCLAGAGAGLAASACRRLRGSRGLGPGLVRPRPVSAWGAAGAAPSWPVSR